MTIIKTQSVGALHGALTYVNNSFDTEPKVLTREIMDQLLDSKDTSKLIEQHRSGERQDAKKNLPAVLFNGLYSALLADRWMAQDPQHSRRQDQCFIPSPFYGIDIDLPNCGTQMYQHALRCIEDKLGDPSLFLAMAYLTPSQGLRLVVKRTEVLSIEQEIQKWHNILNLPIDTKCKNLSRLYLLCHRDDVLYYNPDMLFPPQDCDSLGEKAESLPQEGTHSEEEAESQDQNAIKLVAKAVPIKQSTPPQLAYSDADDDELMDDQCLQDEEIQVPPMPERLPPAIEHIISASPENTRPAVAIACFSALRILLSEVQFKHIDNRDFEPCFMNICIASQASGKSAIRMPLKEILYDIEREDEKNRAEDDDWRAKCAVLSANAERPPAPTSPLRIVQADMTNPALVKLCKRAHPHSLYTYGEEIEKILRLKGASEIIRSAYDCELYGQERVSAASVSEVAQLRWSFNFSTTPNTARRVLKGDTNNGTLSRLCLSTIILDEDDWGEDTPTYGQYGESYRNTLKVYTTPLLQAKGIIHYPEAIKWANDEKIRQTNHLKMMDAKHMLPFLWRSLQMGCWRGYILSIMHGGWSQEIEDFCSWSVSYDMWCKSYYFGQLIEKDFNVVEQGGHRPTMLLPMLQETFTYNDAVSIRRIMNKPTTSRAVRNMLNQWIHRKLVTYDKDTQKYHKTNINH